jgi:hypothetical protein
MTMTYKQLLVLATVVSLGVTVASRTRATVRHERPERKPAITEVGEPYSISMAAVQREAQKISDLRDWIIRNGYPDYAEVQEVTPDWPWESYEVRLYYMHWDLEVDFGHVLFSDAMANLGVLKFQGEIMPEKRHEIEVILQARQMPQPAPPAIEAPPVVEVPPAAPETAPASESGPAESAAPQARSLAVFVARLEAAAERASRAADSAVEQSEAAVRAADRTVSTVEKSRSTLASRPG